MGSPVYRALYGRTLSSMLVEVCSKTVPKFVFVGKPAGEISQLKRGNQLKNRVVNSLKPQSSQGLFPA